MFLGREFNLKKKMHLIYSLLDLFRTKYKKYFPNQMCNV